jgi:hypothetical protein
MARQQELYFVAFLQRHHEVGVFFAGHTEDVLDAFHLEAADQ